MLKGINFCGVQGLRESGNDWFRVDGEWRESYYRLLEGVPGVRAVVEEGVLKRLKVHKSHLPMLPGWSGGGGEDRVRNLGVRIGSPNHPESWIRKLYPHQFSGAWWLRQRRGGLLCDGLGVGKSRTTLAAADPPVLIVCTNSAIESVWEKELDLLGWSYLRLEGQTVDEDYLRQTPDAWVVNYQNAVYWLPYFNDLNPDTVNIETKIADEAHTIHNVRTVYSQAWRACQASRAILLTATPVWSYLRTIWAVLDAAQPNAWGRLWEFRRRYCAAVQGEYGLIDGEPTEESLNELAVRLKEIMLLRTRDDVGQHLPKLSRERLVLDLPDKLRRQLFDDVRYSISPESGAPVLEMRTRQREAIGMTKVAYAADRLIDAARRQHRVVYWIWHHKVAAELSRMLELAGVEVDVLTGETPESKRGPIVYDWEHGDRKPSKPKALVAAIGAAAESISLTAACVEYMVELDYLPFKMQQAETRVHRFGQTRDCTSVYVTARDTFDDDLSEKLIAKAEESEKLLPSVDQGSQIRSIMGLKTETDEEFMIRLGERLKRSCGPKKRRN